MESSRTSAAASLVSPADVGAGLLIGWLVLALRWRELKRYAMLGERLADLAQPFERPLPVSGRSLLIVGDSTGVGTGADHAHETLAGRIAADFPDVHIVNRARNGAKTLDAWRQLDDEGECSYDVVLVHVGGNDVLRRTPLPRLRRHIDALIARACRTGRNVIVTTTPNAGLAPVFFPPLSWWLTLRSRQVRDAFRLACRRRGALYANFFHPRSRDPFSCEWRLYYARDRLHPSSACYGYVYRSLVRSTPLAHWLTGASAASDLGPHVDELGEERDVERLAQEGHAR